MPLWLSVWLGSRQSPSKSSLGQLQHVGYLILPRMDRVQHGRHVNSLRARLLVSLLAMLALVALAMGAISYRNVLAETETKARLYVQGMTPVANTPAEFGQQMDAELVSWGTVVKNRNLAPR